MAVPDPQGRGDFGVELSTQNMQLQISAKTPVLCCHLANTNEELAIPFFLPNSLVLVVKSDNNQ